jgi:hypothetical protein
MVKARRDLKLGSVMTFASLHPGRDGSRRQRFTASPGCLRQGEALDLGPDLIFSERDFHIVKEKVLRVRPV